MDLSAYFKKFRPAIESELKFVIDQSVKREYLPLRSMLAYHMGWEGEGAGDEAQGKRIRPMLVLLTAEASGGKWEKALPAAAAVELVHNFSLIHDDIQDRSELRRGRPTVWVKWGMAQAINAGDLLFTLAQLSVLRLVETASAEAALAGSGRLNETCVSLTEGQFLDLWNETNRSMEMNQYWPMVGGKTAALLACSCEIGALASGAPQERILAFREFGWKIGLAFQALDDCLGIWGDAQLTGKSIESDLATGKKTLPVLFAIHEQGEFARRWMDEKPIGPDEISGLAVQLEREGARAYTEQQADRLTHEALQALDRAVPAKNDAALALEDLSEMLLKRSR